MGDLASTKHCDQCSGLATFSTYLQRICDTCLERQRAAYSTDAGRPYRVDVQADSTGTWVGNGVTFATVTEAAAYARDLYYRWTSVREWRVVDANGNIRVRS